MIILSQRFNRNGLILRKSADARISTFKLRLEEIISVKPLPVDQSPIPCFGFLQIETFARVYYLMVRSSVQLNQWLQAFAGVLGKSSVITAPIDDENLTITRDIDEREEFYLAKPTSWRLDKRRVFNYRKIYFRSLSSIEKYANIKPNELIVRILEMAFQISSEVQSGLSKGNDQLWIKFCDEISLLQCIDLTSLTEAERMAFFLNLYHVMVLHGQLVFGPPPAWNYWNGFFNQISYIVNYELISIAEVEYCILRARMSCSSLFTAVAIPSPPTTVYPILRINSRDFRLHFAINGGSYSMLEGVPIYTPDSLDETLDEITKVSLDSCLDIDPSKKIVYIPKLPVADYIVENVNNAASHVTKANSVSAVLFALLPYLSKSNQTVLKTLLTDPQHITIKHRNLNFRCRILKQYSAGTLNLKASFDYNQENMAAYSSTANSPKDDKDSAEQFK